MKCVLYVVASHAVVTLLKLGHPSLFHCRRRRRWRLRAERSTVQDQITNKIETIENVIDMLGGLIKLDKRTPEKVKDEPKASVEPAAGKEAARAKDVRSEDSSPERLKTKVIESMARKRKDSDRHSNKPDE